VSTRDDLVMFLRRLRPAVADWPDEAVLVGSGMVDSLGLMELALWVEGRLGAPLDPVSFDLATEWRTVGGVVRFLEQRRAGP